MRGHRAHLLGIPPSLPREQPLSTRKHDRDNWPHIHAGGPGATPCTARPPPPLTGGLTLCALLRHESEPLGNL